MAKTLADLEQEIAQTKKEIEAVRGSDCEVYARIVGYYRAVRNWNKGKRQEFDERKVFTPDFSVASNTSQEVAKPADASVPVAAVCNEQVASIQNECTSPQQAIEQTTLASSSPSKEGGLLFADDVSKDATLATTASTHSQTLHYELYIKKTCPNCPPVKSFMSHLKITGSSIDVDTKAGLTQASQNGVFSSPTVIFYDKNNKETARYHSVDELKKDFAA